MFEVGTIVAGKYQVERVIGEGGMGVVVLAQHIQLGQRVALKFMHAAIAKNAAIAERFMREARAVGKLRSDHVCRVSDVGVLDDGAPYIVMEYLAGRDLAAMVAHGGAMPIATAVDFVLQACIAIAEAHIQGIVHRDLKPANLFLTQRFDGAPLIKVLDFGIAKASNDGAMNLTQTATVMGSPGYMSPEQLRSARDVDVRTDVWALGVILFELISGRLPFIAETITEMAVRVTSDPTPHLHHVPPQLDAIISRCLEKDRERRYPDITALATALLPLGGPRARDSAAAIAHITRGSNPAIVSAPTVPAMQTTLSEATGAAAPAPRTSSRRWLWGVAAVAAVGTIVVFVGVQASSRTTPEPPPAVAAPVPAPALPPLDAAVDAARVEQASALDAGADAAVVESHAASPPAAKPAHHATHPDPTRTTKPPGPALRSGSGSADVTESRF